MATYKVDGADILGKYFTAEQKRDDRFVGRASREYAKYKRAQNNWLTFVREKGVKVFMEKLGKKKTGDEEDEQAARGKGKTIYDISHMRRVVLKQNSYIKMNDLAVQAKQIIDDLLKEFADELPPDVSDLFGLLKSMFLEKKKMIYTPGIAAFLVMKNLKNKKLLNAQDLLRQSMDAEISKVHMYAQKKMADGSWGNEV